MKKFKNFMLMLALALFFVGAMGMTKASAADAGGEQNQASPSPSATPSATPAAGEISKDEITYAEEMIKVTANKQVYYQVVKAAEPGKLKPANWIKAAYDTTKKVYCIDFSSVANGKDAYFALTTDNAAEEAAKVSTVDAVIKSVKVGLNYKTEVIGAETGLADVIASLDVKGVDKADDKADGTPADYSLLWKRGANGTWKGVADFEQLDWDMLKASNGTLYVAINGKKVDQKTTLFRMSKEAKVKIPKSAKAPTVKVDFVKGTLALKNGMQIRVNDDTKWMDVIAYEKTAEDNGAFALATKNLKTSKKVSSVLVDDFVAAVKDPKILNMTTIKDGDALTLEVRTAATDKKFPSMSGSLTFKTPAQNIAAAQDVKFTYTKADEKNDVKAEFIINFASIQNGGIEAGKFDAYEYILADKAEDKVDFAKQKWTKCPADGKLDLSTKIGKTYTCVLEGGTKATPKYEDTSVIYFRKAAVKADAKKKIEGVFASKTTKAVVTITEKVVEAKTYAITKPAAGTTVIKVDGVAADKAKEKAAVTVTYAVTDAEKKEVKEFKISYKLEGASETTEKVITVKEGVYSFEMPAAAVTITVTEQDKAGAGA